MLLHTVAESNYNKHIYHLCNSWVKAPNVHHYFQVKIIEQQAAKGAEQVAGQLFAFAQKAIAKHNVAGK